MKKKQKKKILISESNLRKFISLMLKEVMVNMNEVNELMKLKPVLIAFYNIENDLEEMLRQNFQNYRNLVDYANRLDQISDNIPKYIDKLDDLSTKEADQFEQLKKFAQAVLSRIILEDEKLSSVEKILGSLGPQQIEQGKEGIALIRKLKYQISRLKQIQSNLVTQQQQVQQSPEQSNQQVQAS